MRTISKLVQKGIDPLPQNGPLTSPPVHFKDILTQPPPQFFDGIEPGALLGQQESQQAYIAFQFGLSIVGVYPPLQPLALVLTGMVPDDDRHTLLLLTSGVQ